MVHIMHNETQIF